MPATPSPAALHRRTIISQDDVAIAAPIPDWDAKVEGEVIIKMVREKCSFFKGHPEIRPLFLGERNIARYRINFMVGPTVIEFDDKAPQKRTSLATAYVSIKWTNCASQGATEACWEPSFHACDFHKCTEFGKSLKVNRL